jgi:hypothetical protein
MPMPTLLLGFLVLGEPASPYAAAQLELEIATTSIADLPPADSIVTLREAIAETIKHPDEIVGDPELPERLAKARVALVWAYLASGDPDSARMTMDLAIRSAGARPLPIAGLGPEVAKLYDERRTLLESQGSATIEVDCEQCEVIIDEAPSSNPSAPLMLGIHRVWLIDPRGRLEPRFEGVSLAQADVAVELSYRVASPPPPPPPAPEPKRKAAPRWAKLTTMGVGVGLLLVGGVLVGLHHQCRGGATPTADNVDTCPEVRNSMGGGAGLLAAGGGLLLGATVWLTIDEVHASKTKRASALLGWTLRF